jgi:hypothetical protein
MRYCSRCGNALSVGASFCHCCGAELKNLVPEAEEAPKVAAAAESVVEVAAAPVAEPVVESAVEAVAEDPAVEETAPVVVPQHNREELKEEKEFLDMTHRLLRWERKAWSISGKVHLIVGIVFAALFFLLGILYMALGDELIAFSIVFFAYSLIFGCLIIALGIVNLKAADKIPQYTDTLYKDFRAAHKRCGSIGMIIFGYFFNTIALVFYIINFVRMKSCKKRIDRILTRQGVK